MLNFMLPAAMVHNQESCQGLLAMMASASLAM